MAGGPLRVLVVDDDEDFRAMVSLRLDLAGAEVKAVESARAGIEVAGEFQPDIVVLDQVMPETGGLSALRSLLWEVPSDATVYLVSASMSDNLAETARVLGAADAFDKLRFVQEIDQILARRSRSD